MDSPKIKLMYEVARAFETGDVSFLAKHLHNDYRRITYPRSLAKPDQTGEEWLQEVANIWVSDSELTFHWITEAADKVISHLTLKSKTSIGVEVDRESILIVTFSTDGDGILKMKQAETFVDSRAYLDFSKAAAEAKAKMQQYAA